MIFLNFSKQIIFEVIKSISYKMKNWTCSFICPNEVLENRKYSGYVLRQQKERQIWQKSKISSFFVAKNPSRSPKSQNEFFQNIWFCTFAICFDANNVIYEL